MGNPTIRVADIKDSFGSGAGNIPPGQGVPNMRDAMRSALLAGREPAGTAIADTASQHIDVTKGNWRKAGVVSQNCTVTVDTTGAGAGDQIDITRTDNTSAFTIAIVNGGAGAGTLFTMPVSKIAWAKIQFDGTNWALRAFGQQ